MEQIKSWDEAAADYQRVFRMGLNDYNRQLLEFFTSNGLLHPGCSVLDIGCGVGKYGTYFAELGCGVTLTDISPAMLAHAARNMAAYATPWRIVEGDFAMLSTDELSGGAAAGGAYHPALGELVKSRLMLDKMRAVLNGVPAGSRVTLGVNKSRVSQAVGQHRGNVSRLTAEFGLKELKIRGIDAENDEISIVSIEKT